MRFFEKIDEIDIPLARTAKKREKTYVTIISNERGDIITDPTDIKRITGEYDKQLYAYKFDSLDEMDEFLKRYKLLKLTGEEIDNPK